MKIGRKKKSIICLISFTSLFLHWFKNAVLSVEFLARPLGAGLRDRLLELHCVIARMGSFHFVM